MAVERLVSFLNQNGTDFRTIRHDPAYSSLSSAKAAHISGREMVKSVLLKADGSYLLVVLPSTEKIDFHRIKEITGSLSVSLADEEEVESIFPDCSPGAIPPLGNLYHMPVITDSDVLEKKDLFFEAGSHREIMRLHMNDFLKLTHPRIATVHRDF
ncbi:aminoacyl-tRNA deacylase [Spirochaeta isovalerica]|uniref:Ala-tRNA(Pro) deacylase n=1 Tax=Spirochaeta isovalerica TaxID=150 RepID=A0A841RF78_9SPIO|nr:YbaK/EbsC family protein [Spirochaeta isovalerica]MBB6482643.1 Ala-tRNA(Pro) deacylase [Spirochaeta isovalerica]